MYLQIRNIPKSSNKHFRCEKDDSAYKWMAMFIWRKAGSGNIVMLTLSVECPFAPFFRIFLSSFFLFYGFTVDISYFTVGSYNIESRDVLNFIMK